MKIIYTIGGLIGLFLIWLCLYVPIFGFHYETLRGEHTGFVTAVEKTGIFFKTGRAYVKTDTQSSQEDSYCVIDENVYQQLQKASVDKVHVNLYFFGWFSAGIKNCEGEGQIVYKVEPLK